MMRFPVIDARVIDYVFQPIADRLETHDISIFTIARFLMDGTVLAFLANMGFAIYLDGFVHVDIPLTCAFSAMSIVTCFAIFTINRTAIQHAERTAKPGMLNPARYRFFPLRIASIGFFIMDAVELFFQPNLARFFGFVGWLLWMLAAYIASCSRRPGMRQTNKIISGVRAH